MVTNISGSIAVRRRPVGGSPGSPATLRSGEPAFNEADNTLYIGIGDDGEGNATSIIGIAGDGLFATKQYVTDAMSSAGAGDMLKADYDTDNDGIVDRAEVANAVDWAGVQGKPSAFVPAPHGHDNATASEPGFMSAADWIKLRDIAPNANNYVHPTTDGNRHVPATGAGDVGKFLKSGASAGAMAVWSVLSKADVGLGNVDNISAANMPVSTDQQAALDLKANRASPAFTGTPTAPTAAPATNTQQLATTAFVAKAIGDLIGGAPGALDTFKELADALGGDANFAATIVNGLATKLTIAQNLADLTDKAAARSNLGLGGMATQDPANVNITGGTISGAVIDGGTF